MTRPATIATRIGLAPGRREENEGPVGSVIALFSTVHMADRAETRRGSQCGRFLTVS